MREHLGVDVDAVSEEEMAAKATEQWEADMNKFHHGGGVESKDFSSPTNKAKEELIVKAENLHSFQPRCRLASSVES